MEKLIREPAVAGLFYPDDVSTLKQQLDSCLTAEMSEKSPPKAIIVPHAGYVYSGRVAASAYARLKQLNHRIERVVMLGPAHRVAFQGLAVPANHYFRTPLGVVEIDFEAVNRLACRYTQVVIDDLPHASEHSLEVQLPFLQTVLGEFKLLPFVVGRATVNEVAEVISDCWGGEETLIIVSSDLSHFHDYPTAVKRDSLTSTAIVTLQGNGLGPEDACGYLPVRGLLVTAREKGLTGELIQQTNSGDTAGTKDRVVGYGAYGFN